MRMHADQVDVAPATVARLVVTSFPSWAGLPVTPVRSSGTVNALFLLGDEVVVRLPLRPDPSASGRIELETEQAHARMLRAALGGRVHVDLPEPLGLGEPGPGYAGHWSAYRWIPGTLVTSEREGRSKLFAAELASFVTALHAIDGCGLTWEGHGRGGPLADHDAQVTAALTDVAADIRRGDVPITVDPVAVAAVWNRAQAAARDPAADTWIHADLMPGNLLHRRGSLAAVIDLGAVGVGDPAVDLMPAWNLLSGPARIAFRSAVAADEDEWLRGQGWAVLQAAIALPYYVRTNVEMARTAVRTLAAVASTIR